MGASICSISKDTVSLSFHTAKNSYPVLPPRGMSSTTNQSQINQHRRNKNNQINPIELTIRVDCKRIRQRSHRHKQKPHQRPKPRLIRMLEIVVAEPNQNN